MVLRTVHLTLLTCIYQNIFAFQNTIGKCTTIETKSQEVLVPFAVDIQQFFISINGKFITRGCLGYLKP